MTSAIPVRCSTNRPMEPHIGSEVNLLSSWAFSIYQEIPENFGNFVGKCLSAKDVFHFTHSSHSSQAGPSSSDVFPAKIQNDGTTVELLNEMLNFSLEEECLVNSDDDDIPYLAAVATKMRRHLPRNKGFYGNILLEYKLTNDEFKSHFRMTRGTFEVLCREVQATGRVPKFLNQEPSHDRQNIRRKRRKQKPPS